MTVSVFRHAARHLRPQRSQPGFRIVTGELTQATGQNHRFAGKGAINLFRVDHDRRRPADAFFTQLSNHFAVALFGKEITHVRGNHNPDIGHFLQIVN